MGTANAVSTGMVQVTCTNGTFNVGWDNSNSYFADKGNIAEFYCYIVQHTGYISDSVTDPTLLYYQGIVPVPQSQVAVVDSETQTIASQDTVTSTVETQTVVSQETQTVETVSAGSPAPVLVQPETSAVSQGNTVDSLTSTSDSQTSSSQSPQLPQQPETSSVVQETATVDTSTTSTETQTVIQETQTATSQTLPQEPLSTPIPAVEPQPAVQVPAPQPEPQPQPVPVPPVVDIVPEKTPSMEEEVPIPVEVPAEEVPIEQPAEEQQPVEELPESPDAVEQPLPQDEPSPVEDVVPSPQPSPVPVAEPVPTSQPDIAYEPPVVTLANGVILTQEVAAQVEMLQNPAELLSELFTNPTAVFAALGSVGADMSPQAREKSKKAVVQAVVVGSIVTQAAGAAAYRRKP